MRALHGLLLILAAGCPNRQNVQCLDDTSCDRFAGGLCRLTVTGNRWCSYPDSSCPEGYRYSDFDVGDGVSGQCVTSSGDVDAGVDGGGNGSCVPELLFQRGSLFQMPKILRVDLESYNEIPVSNDVDYDVNAEWSPDGNRMVLTRNLSSIWVVNRDGSNPIPLASETGNSLLSPAWSPDGTRVAYTSQPIPGGTSTLLVMASDGTGTPNNLSLGEDAQGPLDWSPDGTQILFTSNRTGDRDLFKMFANGSSSMNLTNQSSSDGVDAFDWSPDGSKIVFISSGSVVVANADGSDPNELTSSYSHSAPVWSHDGQKIFYVREPISDASGEIWVMNANGAGQHLLIGGSIDASPQPSPDGTKLAWSSKRDGNQEIYVANIDGSNPVRVTNNSRPDGRPRWRPCR